MNQGMRYLRNTIVAMAGVTLVMAVSTRIYNSTVDDKTPAWVRSALSLGLEVEKNQTPEPPLLMTATTPAQLANLHDFTQISVEGDLAVEIVGATAYKVSLTPTSEQAWSLATAQQTDGLLKLTGGTGTEGAVLRIETPALTRIDALGSRLLSVQGIEAPALTVHLKNVGKIHLQQNKVARWNLNADTSALVLIDKTIPGSGLPSYNLNLSGRGHITVRNGE